MMGPVSKSSTGLRLGLEPNPNGPVLGTKMIKKFVSVLINPDNNVLKPVLSKLTNTRLLSVRCLKVHAVRTGESGMVDHSSCKGIST